MKQKRLMITFFLFCMMMLLLMQTESIRANTRQKVKLNYETETKTKSVELYQYKGNGKKDQISNYEFVGEMNDEGNGQWKMMIERAEQNQYALSINHKEYLEYFSAKIQDIGDIKTNIPEIFCHHQNSYQKMENRKLRQIFERSARRGILYRVNLK